MKKTLDYIIEKKRKFTIYLVDGTSYNVTQDPVAVINRENEYISMSYDNMGIELIGTAKHHILIPWSSVSRIEFWLGI